MTPERTQEINDALDVLNEAARDDGAELEEIIRGKYEELKEMFAAMELQAGEKAQRGMDRMMDKCREAGDMLKQHAQWADEKVRERPWESIGFAAAAAFGIGYLVGRKI